MPQEEVFSQLWGLGSPEPWEDPQASSLNQDLSSYQQFARSEEVKSLNSDTINNLLMIVSSPLGLGIAS